MKKNLLLGQSLVEYALILVLVAIVIIAALSLLGSSLSQVYYNLVNQINSGGGITPSPTPSWTFCADEHGTCDFSGTKQVRYGKNSSWNYGTFTNSVACDNDTFGDPLYGTVKECDYQ
jgi:Flp pilus assembly pilin Flp